MAEAVRATRQGANTPEFSVSELSAAIKRTLEGTYGYVRLRGEISGFRGAHSSGHCYFSLKDDKARSSRDLAQHDGGQGQPGRA